MVTGVMDDAAERDRKTERERLAVLEHRADRQDELLKDIAEWMRKLTESQSELVKLQTDRAHDIQRIERLEREIDTERDVRRQQNEDQKVWAEGASGSMRLNSSWVDWFKTVLVALFGALVGGVLAAFSGVDKFSS